VGATGVGRGELGRADASAVAPDGGWYEMAFRLVVLLRRGRQGGAPDALPGLDAHWDDNDAGTGADAGAGSARGMKNGRFAALREFGGSSEYREWIRGRAMGDCVVSMVLLVDI
jgi:hypothetical protein